MKSFLISLARLLWLNDFISVDMYVKSLQGVSFAQLRKSQETKWSWLMWRY